MRILATSLLILIALPLAYSLSITTTLAPNSPVKGLLIITIASDQPALNASVTLNNSAKKSVSNPNQTSFILTYDTLTEVNDGSYSLQATVNSLDESVQTTQTVLIDNTAPVLAYKLSSFTVQTTQSIEINATASDMNEVVASVNLSGTQNKPLSLSGNQWRTTFTTTELGCPSSGSCSVTLRAADSAGNLRIEPLTLILNDTTPPPLISLQLPLPDIIANNSYFLLKYSVNESNPPDSLQPLCGFSLFKESKILRKSDHYLNNFSKQGSLYTFSQRITGLSDGLYTFNLSCSNKNSVSSVTQGFVTVIDKTAPSIKEVNVDPFEKRAHLNGESDEEVTVQVQYSTSLNDLNNAPYQPATGTNTAFYYNFRSLESATPYYYQVILQDFSNNRITFGPYNFTTLGITETTDNTSGLSKEDYPSYLDNPALLQYVLPLLSLAGEAKHILTLNDSLSIRQIAFFLKETINQAQIIAFKLDTLPSTILPVPEREFYSGIYLYHPGLDNNQLQEITLQFAVQKKWLAEKEYTKESISVYRHDNNLWVALPTSLLKEDSYEIIYEVNSPGLSFFAITGNPVTKLNFTPPLPQITEKQPENATTLSEPEAKTSYTWLWLILLFIGLSALGTYLYIFTDLKEKLKPKQASLSLESQETLIVETKKKEIEKKNSYTELPPNFEQLYQFVKQCLARGIPHDKLKQKLEVKGWKAEAIEEAIRRCKDKI